MACTVFLRTFLFTQVTGEGVRGTQGTVVSVSDQNDAVTIQLSLNNGGNADTANMGLGACSDNPSYSDTIKVPLARVQPVRNEVKCFEHCFGMYLRQMYKSAT